MKRLVKKTAEVCYNTGLACIAISGIISIAGWLATTITTDDE